MSLKKFLKQFSNVPNKFIDDFFDISKESYLDDEFAINFDIVVKWLKVLKENLKRLLIGKFEENYDYIINKVKKKTKEKGKPFFYVIYLTPDCFKELCMLSQTAKAKEVRKYYLSIEKLIRKYHQKIKNDLYKELGLLKYNQKPKVNRKKGVVYILKALNTSATIYKIGRAKNLKNRLKNYNADKANDVQPIFVLEVDDIDKVEACIKNLVKDFQYRKFKEVYEVDLEILKNAFVKCGELVDGFRKFHKNKTRKNIKKKIKEIKNKNNNLFAYIQK